MADTIKIGSLDVGDFKVGSDDCTIYLGDTLLYPKDQSYTLLKGIERKEGYLGYVDLGLTIETDFHIEIQLNYKTSAGGRFFGIDNTFRWFLAGGNAYYDYNGQRIVASASNYPLNTDYTVTLDNYRMYTSYGSSYTTVTTQSSYTSQSNLGVFSTGLQSNGDLGVIYGVKVYTNCIYDGNDFVSGTLVGDFIPVRKNSNNVVTMYNTVTNTFCDAYGSLYGVELPIQTLYYSSYNVYSNSGSGMYDVVQDGGIEITTASTSSNQLKISGATSVCTGSTSAATTVYSEVTTTNKINIYSIDFIINGTTQAKNLMSALANNASGYSFSRGSSTVIQCDNTTATKYWTRGVLNEGETPLTTMTDVGRNSNCNILMIAINADDTWHNQIDLST